MGMRHCGPRLALQGSKPGRSTAAGLADGVAQALALLLPASLCRLFASFKIGAFGCERIDASLMFPFGLVIGSPGFFHGPFHFPALLLSGGLLPALFGVAPSLFLFIGECGFSFGLVIRFAGTRILRGLLQLRRL